MSKRTVFEILSSTIPRIFRSSLKSYNKFCDFIFNSTMKSVHVKRTFINSDIDVRKKECFFNYFCYSYREREYVILLAFKNWTIRYIENKSTTVDNSRKIGVSQVKGVSNRTSSTFVMAAKLADSGKGKEKRSKVKYSSMVLLVALFSI